MKITIDTTRKTIEVEENLPLHELTSEIKKMLPDTWKEYTISAQKVVSYPVYPLYPYYQQPRYINPFYPYGTITVPCNGITSVGAAANCGANTTTFLVSNATPTFHQTQTISN